jgi:uncharacterized protein (TIGR02246 family)
MTAVLETPEEFARRFGQLWGARDADGLAALMAEDASFLSLTGGFADGRKAIIALLKGEMSGVFSKSRLVTGKSRQRPISAETSILYQRFVLSGLIDAEGSDMGRVGAMVIAVLTRRTDGWKAESLQFSAVEA